MSPQGQIIADLEQQIVAYLRAGPMLQKDIMAVLPLRHYIQAGNAIRALDRRGVIEREKAGKTYLVRLKSV